MISCATHAERESTAFCLRCERPLCAACSKTFAGKTYCETCAADLERKAEERYQGVGGPATGGLPVDLPVMTAPITPTAPLPYGRSLLFAILGGALGALLWFAVVAATDLKLGIVAIGRRHPGRPRGGLRRRRSRRPGHRPPLGGGRHRRHGAGGVPDDQSRRAQVHGRASDRPPASGFIGLNLFAKVYGADFGFMDLVFYGIGAHQAWRPPAAAPE